VWLKPGSEIQAGEVHMRFAAQKAPLRMPPSQARRFGHLVGDSVPMREVFTLLDRISPSEATLLMVGETGTGKGAMARSVHEKSKRATGPFFLIDCGAISDTLIESELFGHERGAFTGADRQRIGLLEAASGGTLFLDEIDDLPMDLQPKLLRALEERVFQRVGSSTPIKFDARIIAASKKDLWAMVQQGRFREDLFFRLSVFTVNLPPLRERREDLPALATELVGAETWLKLPHEVREQLLAHSWPGNVRELRNALERASHLANMPGGVTVEQVLPQRSVPPPPRLGAPPTAATNSIAAPIPQPQTPPTGIPIEPAQYPSSRTTLRAPEVVPVDFDTDYKTAKDKLLASFEREYLARLLQRTNGNVSAAARIAGIDRKHFSTLLRRHSLIGRR
ncbi:MAG: sigma-54-dependent Fis family transcriptional regulator, partial [Deltaproteobacteria bacterium]|nr:sigma-54-dependent Fis family transcriptional regulator [Deltaproteobacteria bacterium]